MLMTTGSDKFLPLCAFTSYVLVKYHATHAISNVYFGETDGILVSEN